MNLRFASRMATDRGPVKGFRSVAKSLFFTAQVQRSWTVVADLQIRRWRLSEGRSGVWNFREWNRDAMRTY
jgi:hypothetical protein